MSQTPAQIARAVRTQARAVIVGQVGRTEGAISRAWAPTLRKLERELAGASPAQAQILIDRATQRLAETAAAHIARGITTTSTLGARAASAQHRATTGPNGPIPNPQGSLFPPEAEARAASAARTLAEARVNGSFARDRVPLSSRLYRQIGETGQSAGRVVRSSIEAREGVFRAAENFIEQNRDAIRVEVPRYTQDLIDAARRAVDSGDRAELLATIREHAGQMDRLGVGASRRDGTTSLRSAVRQFANDVQRATPQNIERLIQRHLEDRAQFQARRIARSEMAEAHRGAYLASTRDQPYVVGIRWKLSPAHPRADVCDLYANQDLHGLGPGGYPPNDYPDTPHPNCLCQPESISDPYYFRRQRAELDGTEPPPRPWESGTTESAEQWLARQPGAFQRELLGPTRHDIFRDPNDSRRVIDNRGRPIPVGDVLGVPTGRAPTATVPLRRDQPVAQQSPVNAAPVNAAPAPPPPPPAPARSRSAGQVPLHDAYRDAMRELSDAYNAPDTQREAAAREAGRRLYQTIYPASNSRSLREGHTGADELAVRVLHPKRLVRGSYGTASGLMSFDPQDFAEASIAGSAYAAGTTLTRDQVYGLATVLHEVSHEHSVATTSALISLTTGVKLQGLVVEEVTTELLAREGLRRLGVVDSSHLVTGGGLRTLPSGMLVHPPYQAHIERTLDAVLAEVPQAQGWSRQQAAEYVVAAAHRLRSANSRIEDSTSYVDAFAAALGVPSARHANFRRAIGRI